jgi:hypothetical protein
MHQCDYLINSFDSPSHTQSEWAYGSKGLPEAGIPKNAKLIFEVELMSIGI